MSSFVGSSGCVTKYIVVNVDPCPAMSKNAIGSWSDVYPLATPDLRVWMGQIILYCELQEARLTR